LMDEPQNDAEEPRILDSLRELPLLDEVFLGMQAMNVDLVDAYLEGWEEQLLQEYMQRDRTPSESAVSVSAFSQMWVFAVYELLRTWRGRVREIVKWADRVRALDGAEREAAGAAKRDEIERRASELLDAEIRWQVFGRAVSEPAFVEELRLALNRTEIAFRDIEAVRITLAKHELPRQGGVSAGAPGYGRIDMETGSIYWQVELGRDEVTIISRRGLADMLRALAQPNSRILPSEIQERIAPMERQAYGRNRVVVVLDDGMEFSGVHVLWATEVVWVEGHEGLPFEVARVIDVRNDPAPEVESDDDAPF
jgi:hypothetical protein